MRAIYVLRGAPGAGKSTWVRENGYAPLSISPDTVRLTEVGIDFDASGTPSISQREDRVIWEKVKVLVEERMQRGLTTVLDSTMADLSRMSVFCNLAERYRYRIYIVDFTWVDVNVCKERNSQRSAYSRVPEYVIDRLYSKFKKAKIPSSLPVIMPEEAKGMLDAPMIRSVDEYAAVNLIGDVHGCYTALISLLEQLGGSAESDYLCPGELYIFLGDYLDRGLENAQTLEYLMHIAPLKNVVVLDGNHEKALSSWACGEPVQNSGFLATQNQLEAAGVEKKEARRFIRRLAQFALYEYRGKKIFACHGGISLIPRPFAYVSSNDLIFGFGSYKDVDEMEEVWESNSQDNGIILVHGHRSGDGSDIHPYERVYCLEGGVEYGGVMRCVRFEEENVSTLEVLNTVFESIQECMDIDGEKDMGRVIDLLRSNKCVIEKKFENISSFNFSNMAFLKGIWDKQSIHARGLFIDTEAKKVKARSYDKFFNLEERPETSLEELRKKMAFPVDIFLKENGYLGIVAGDGEGKLFTASKSSSNSVHARRLADRLDEQLGDKRAEFSQYLGDNDLSAVFEVVEPKDDPHIVEYDAPRLVLLALVQNSIRFNQVSYPEMRDIAWHFDLEPKELLATAKNFNEFCSWVNKLEDEEWVLGGKHIEGFVAEDRFRPRMKVKGRWYRKWKTVRGMLKDIAIHRSSSKVEKARVFYPDADMIYEAAKEFVALQPKERKNRKGLCPPPIAENVILFRNWYEQKYSHNRFRSRG